MQRGQGPSRVVRFSRTRSRRGGTCSSLSLRERAGVRAAFLPLKSSGNRKIGLAEMARHGAARHLSKMGSYPYASAVCTAQRACVLPSLRHTHVGPRLQGIRRHLLYLCGRVGQPSRDNLDFSPHPGLHEPFFGFRLILFLIARFARERFLVLVLRDGLADLRQRDRLRISVYVPIDLQ